MDNLLKTKIPKNKEKELQQDVVVLREIIYETIEKSILLQQKIKDKMPENNSKEKSILQAIKKNADVSNFIFFDPKQVINNFFDKNRDEDLLIKIRKTRLLLTKLVINIDKVIFKLNYENSTNLYKQFKIFLHIFDGLGYFAKKERNDIRDLIRKLRGYKGEPQPIETIVLSLSKVRLIVMFFIKWLTLADNQFTDNNIKNATDEEKKEFEKTLSKNLSSLLNSEQHALGTYLINKLNSIEIKIVDHSEESRTTLRLIHDDILAIKETCIKLASQNPEEAKSFIETRAKEIESLLKDVENTLRSVDRGNSAKAKKWREHLVSGIGITADIIGLLSFISGIPSIPALIYSPQANHSITILKQFSEKLRL
jgi:hypothetical protein